MMEDKQVGQLRWYVILLQGMDGEASRSEVSSKFHGTKIAKYEYNDEERYT